MSKRAYLLVPAAGLTLGMMMAPSVSAEAPSYSYSAFGTVGLIDMPTAQSADDAELAVSVNQFAGSTRTTLSFQITPRLSGSFRYVKIDDFDAGDQDRYDRSFDLRYRFIDEGRIRPAVAIGLRDFIGTGIYSGEYLVATKTLGRGVSVTTGLGWGRLGSYNGFDNPLGIFDDGFETRPSGTTGKGGQIESAKWFSGDAAFFGGLAWHVSDKLSVKAEYSSDAYTRERGRADLFERETPFNFGVEYRPRPWVQMDAYAMHGTTLGFGVTFLTNPRKPPVLAGTEAGPAPVAVRSPGSAADLGWTQKPEQAASLRANTERFLEAEGLTLESLVLSPRSVSIGIQNLRYLATAEAIGRTARVLTQTMPASVETFRIIAVEKDMPLSEVILQRSDLEAFVHAPDGAWETYVAAEIRDAAGSLPRASLQDPSDQRFTWSLGPYLVGSYFDPDNPVRLDYGAALEASYTLAPGLYLSGMVKHRLIGNRDEAARKSDSTLPRVRSEANLYAKADTTLSDLTLAYYFRPGKNLYGRVTAGYLEPMFAGVSGELLWKPVKSRLGFGAELNHVWQRDFEQGFGLQDYDVTTGHVSAYYDFGNGFEGQIDAGRYLAGDWGATFALDRTFNSGWSVGAYATLTDVPFEDFGEGSFDKGIRISIPLQHFTKAPSRNRRNVVIQPITRDGGARLSVNGRLYDTIDGYHVQDLRDSWGRFWR